MTPYDITIPALCAWRENRGGGRTGMQSVLNVLANRAAKHGTTMAQEATRAWQFSSMTAPGDPQLILYPSPLDPQFITAMVLAQDALNGTLPDITDGAQFYFALSMTTPPTWAESMTKTVEIQGQAFYKESA